jgi:hypothetical protein
MVSRYFSSSRRGGSMKHSRNLLGLMVLVSSLVLTGCAAGSAAQEETGSSPAPTDSGEFNTIPRTTNRPSDPPPPSDYDQDSNSLLTPAEASMNQLWALADSEVGDDAEPSTLGRAAGLRDFAAAVTSRCYPVRTADQVAELEKLKLAYESAADVDVFEPGRAYFVRATELCM